MDKITTKHLLIGGATLGIILLPFTEYREDVEDENLYEKVHIDKRSMVGVTINAIKGGVCGMTLVTLLINACKGFEKLIVE